MLLPRPARLLRQCPTLLRPAVQRCIATTPARHAQLDESYHPFMNDMLMGSSRQRPNRASAIPDRQDQDVEVTEDTSAVASSSSPSAYAQSAESEYDHEDGGREERRAPATVIGAKRVGLVILPEQLTESIQQEINGKLGLVVTRPSWNDLKLTLQLGTPMRSAVPFFSSTQPPVLRPEAKKASAFEPLPLLHSPRLLHSYRESMLPSAVSSPSCADARGTTGCRRDRLWRSQGL